MKKANRSSRIAPPGLVSAVGRPARVHLLKGCEMKKWIVLVCILSVVLTGGIIAGCGGGGGESSGQSAEAAAKSFFSAYQNKDANTSWDLLSAESKKQVKKSDWEKFLKQSGTMSFTVGKVTVTGDKATAKVTASVGGQSSTEDIPLLKENGAWKVNMAGINTND